MKKIFLYTLSLALIMTIVACGAAGDLVQNATTGGQGGARQQGDGPGPLPLQAQLLLGTFKLEGTDLAVDADTASQLLPLWKLLRNLSEEQTAATGEIDALIEQIQETLSEEQRAAIEEMALTRQDMRPMMEELGIEFAGRGQGGEGGGRGQGGEGGGRGQGGQGGGRGQGGPPPPGGGFGGGQGGRGGGFGGADLSNDEIATRIAQRRANGGGGRGGVNPALYEALVELLEERAGG